MSYNISRKVVFFKLKTGLKTKFPVSAEKVPLLRHPARLRRGGLFGAKKGPSNECESLKGPKKIPGIVLLSHSQLYSTIAAGALNYRVREGNVCVCSAMDTGKNHNEESLEDDLFEKKPVR